MRPTAKRPNMRAKYETNAKQRCYTFSTDRRQWKKDRAIHAKKFNNPPKWERVQNASTKTYENKYARQRTTFCDF